MRRAVAGLAALACCGIAAADMLVVSPHSGAMQIYRLADDGAKAAALTQGPGDNANAVWSPDGSRIAFISTRDRSPQVYVMNADGSSQRRLSGPSDSNSNPAWSPDGRSVAYTSARNAQHGIYRADAKSGLEVRLTATSVEANTLAWSPDGDTIAFVSASGARESNVFGLDLRSGAVRNLSQSKGSGDHSPNWSPDGQWLVYVVSAGRKGINLHLMKADGSEKRALTTTVLSNSMPTWSPDGKSLAYVSNVDGGERGDIFVMDLASGSSRNLTRHPHEDFEPAWAPDAKSIVFTSFRSGVSQVYRTTLDGKVEPVSRSGQYESTPLPQPDAGATQRVDARQSSH